MSTKTNSSGAVSTAVPRKKKPLLAQLWVWVIIGLLAGVVVGIAAPEFAIGLAPLGTAFVSVMKMIVAPVILCAVVGGIQAVDSIGSAGRLGAKALGYFITVTLFLMIVGLFAGHLFKPGEGMNIDPSTLATDSLPENVTQHADGWGFVLHVIPTTLFSAFTGDDILAILIVSLLIGFAIKAVGEPAAGIARGLENFSKIVFKIVHWVLWISPLGAFGAIAATVGKYGGESLANLGALVLWFTVTAIIVIVVLFGAITAFTGLNLFKLIRYLKDEVFIGLATVSGEAVLPSMMEKLEYLGVRRDVVRLVLPAGYSFNLDGTALYITMAILFMAQATNTDLSVGTQIGMILLLLLISKGSAGVPGGVLIVLASTMGGIVPIPLAALSLIVGVDRLMSESRTTITILGNAVAVLVIGKWEKAIDMDRARAILDKKPVPAL